MHCSTIIEANILMNKHKAFSTDRLTIRPTSEDDAEFIFELLNTPKWIEFIGDRDIKNVNDAATYIQEKMLPQLNKLGFSNNTVIRKEDGVKVGTCGLFDRDGLEGIDIGFAFLPQYEGNGYAFESVNELKNIAFSEFGLKEINAITVKNNISSQNLLIKLGLKLERTVKLKGENEELLFYQIKK